METMLLSCKFFWPITLMRAPMFLVVVRPPRQNQGRAFAIHVPSRSSLVEFWYKFAFDDFKYVISSQHVISSLTSFHELLLGDT